MPRQLHLFRHAPVVVNPSIPSSEWQLAPGTEEAVISLAETISSQAPKRIVSSRQTKAVQTAKILATYFNVPLEQRTGLEEHHRENEPFKPSQADFSSTLEQFFKHPDEQIFGSETASQTLSRIGSAIAKLMAETNNDELVVTHGTAMSLFLSKAGGTPFEIWKSLSLADIRTINWPPEFT